MDPYSSGEELVIKTRKPYTITKQRERWTEEEHNRFLEALKLYGRAWQRIEEHIGTKTAVQIRSHAQKFFTKLEKEAFVKGVPIGQALDIEIPPPRPKRKPSNPYPRKTTIAASPLQVGAKDGKLSAAASFVRPIKDALDLEKQPLPEKHCCDEKLGNANESQDEDNCSEIFTIFQEAPYISPSSANKSSHSVSVACRETCSFREFVPTSKERMTQDNTNKSNVTNEQGGHQVYDKTDARQHHRGNASCNTSKLGNSCQSNGRQTQSRRADELNQSENLGAFLTNDIQSSQNYPRHVPVHILDGSLEANTWNVSSDMPYHESSFHQMAGAHGHTNLFPNPASSASIEHNSSASASTIQQSFPTFRHPIFTPIRNQNDYQSFLHISSTFSSLIISALLQNPASHAAASFAAAFWPCANVESPTDSPTGGHGGIPSRQMNSTPSMAAIAAATVAAATAWWAAHGLLPLCSPFHGSFTCAPTAAAATAMDVCQARAAKNERRDEARDPALQAHQPNPECSEALLEQHSASKSPTLSTSDSEESEDVKLKKGLVSGDNEQVAVVTELHDSKMTKNRKQVDRSSCGSNTSSSSEVETDALKKNEKGMEELKDPQMNHPPGDSGTRRGRSTSNSSDSWKEVSEEGRLAFQALFSREVLPQSFSPPHDQKSKEKGFIENDKRNGDEKDGRGSQLDLNNHTAWSTCSNPQRIENNAFFRGDDKKEKGLLSIGLEQAKLKACRTGFKPYKRCSVEVKDSSVAGSSSPDEEKAGPKRIRLEGQTST